MLKSDKLERIHALLNTVDQQGVKFLETLAASNDFVIEVGKVEILHGEDGRAYFLSRPDDGLPLWPDLSLTSQLDPALKVNLNLSFSEHEVEYFQLRDRHLTRTAQGENLGKADALEGLILAELVKDRANAEILIKRLSRQFSNIHFLLYELIGRGNTRIRSALGRVLALLNTSEGWSTLRQLLAEEEASGVRADIICTAIIQGEGQQPLAVLKEWLCSELLIDPLSCIQAYDRLRITLPSELHKAIRPQFQRELAPWFGKN